MTDISRVPPPRAMARERRAALRRLLEEEVRKTYQPWWRRSWRSFTVGGGALTLVLASGAATAYVAFKPAEDKASVLCYAAPDLDSDHLPGARVAVAQDMPAGAEDSESGTIAITDPLATCSQAWRDGLIGPEGVREPPEPTATHQVPNLVACTLEEGVAAVFPGPPSTCERLGLPRTVSERTGTR
ncbi:MAG TPA: hypothetical protein VIL34_01455 [Actinopolymorphaceae bacterium]|jgi:hypothetical protein